MSDVRKKSMLALAEVAVAVLAHQAALAHLLRPEVVS